MLLAGHTDSRSAVPNVIADSQQRLSECIGPPRSVLLCFTSITERQIERSTFAGDHLLSNEIVKHDLDVLGTQVDAEDGLHRIAPSMGAGPRTACGDIPGCIRTMHCAGCGK